MKKLSLFIFVFILTCTASHSQTIRIARLKGAPDTILGAMLLKDIYRRAGLSLEILVMPSRRSLEESSKGRIDGELQRIFAIGKQYPTLIRVPTSYSYFEPAVFSKKYKFKVSGWSSVRDYLIGFVRGMKYAELGTEGFEKLYKVTSCDQLIKMVDAERLDIAITSRFNGLYHIRALNLNSVRQLQPVIERHKVYNYLHEKHRKLIPKIDKVIKSMKKSGELERLREKFIQEILK